MYKVFPQKKEKAWSQIIFRASEGDSRGRTIFKTKA